MMERRPPNIVFIFTDSQEWRHTSCYGGYCPTPHMDRLAAEGMRFTRFQPNSPLCVPARFNVLTGCYASRSVSVAEEARSWAPCIGQNTWLLPGDESVAMHAKVRGYATGLVGKWHCGTPDLVPIVATADPGDPAVREALLENDQRVREYVQQLGFDEVRALNYKNADAEFVPEALRYHNQDEITKEAVEFIDRHREEPFFLHVCPTLPHGPGVIQMMLKGLYSSHRGVLDGPSGCQPPYESVLERLANAKTDIEHRWWIDVPLRKQAWVEGLEAYTMMTWLDDAVGAILDKLEACGLAENTVVILASDHGEHGKKTCNHVPIPCLVRWPGVARPGAVCDELVGTVDLAPTVLDACGVADMAQAMDGRSIRPLLEEKPAGWPRNLYMEMGYARGILSRDSHYIAVRFPESVGRNIPNGDCRTVDQSGIPAAELEYKEQERFPSYFDADQLHDLQDDPDQQVNLADGAPSRLLEMKDLLDRHMRRMGHRFGEMGCVGGKDGRHG